MKGNAVREKGREGGTGGNYCIINILSEGLRGNFIEGDDPEPVRRRQVTFMHAFLVADKFCVPHSPQINAQRRFSPTGPRQISANLLDSAEENFLVKLVKGSCLDPPARLAYRCKIKLIKTIETTSRAF